MKSFLARSLPLLALLLASGVAFSARAETKLTTEVFTASAPGFLVTSTLIAGEKEAVLVDGQFTLSDAHRLVGMILDSKKTLTTVYVTVQGDDAANSYVWIPSIKTVVTGDIVYQGMFPWTAETNAASRVVWSKTLDELSALGATKIVAGHKEPTLKDDATGVATTKAYLKDFDEAAAASKSASELQAKMKAKYPKLAMDIVLQIGAGAQFPAAPAEAPKK